MAFLTEIYRRQLAWRDWPTVFSALPLVPGQLVLDLGCGIGDQAALLASRGARVIAVDDNDEMLAAAESQGLKDVEFRKHDLCLLPDLRVAADGIWSSFSAAYFPDFSRVLSAWEKFLRPGGWIALTEVDDLFGHEPLTDKTSALLKAYAAESTKAERYDFHMGRKLRPLLEGAGFKISHELLLPDKELSFSGPASADVLEGWRNRFGRMQTLRRFLGSEYESVKDDFLGCQSRQDHHSKARVYCLIATKAPVD